MCIHKFYNIFGIINVLIYLNFKLISTQCWISIHLLNYLKIFTDWKKNKRILLHRRNSTGRSYSKIRLIGHTEKKGQGTLVRIFPLWIYYPNKHYTYAVAFVEIRLFGDRSGVVRRLQICIVSGATGKTGNSPRRRDGRETSLANLNISRLFFGVLQFT